jgi:hypothetical protein
MHATDQEVPQSGIYRVKHEAHRLPREVVLIAGNKFPRCGKCSREVRFELVKATPYMSSRANVIVHEISAKDRDDGGSNGGSRVA